MIQIVETDAGYKFVYNDRASSKSYKTKREAYQAWLVLYNI